MYYEVRLSIVILTLIDLNRIHWPPCWPGGNNECLVVFKNLSTAANLPEVLSVYEFFNLLTLSNFSDMLVMLMMADV